MMETAVLVGGLCLGYVIGFASCGLFVTWIASPYIDDPDDPEEESDEEDFDGWGM